MTNTYNPALLETNFQFEGIPLCIKQFAHSRWSWTPQATHAGQLFVDVVSRIGLNSRGSLNRLEGLLFWFKLSIPILDTERVTYPYGRYVFWACLVRFIDSDVCCKAETLVGLHTGECCDNPQAPTHPKVILGTRDRDLCRVPVRCTSWSRCLDGSCF